MLDYSIIFVYFYHVFVGLGVLGVTISARKIATYAHKIYQLMYGKYQERTLTITEEELSKFMDRWKTRLIKDSDLNNHDILYITTTARLGIEEAMQKARTKVWAVKL